MRRLAIIWQPVEGSVQLSTLLRFSMPRLRALTLDVRSPTGRPPQPSDLEAAQLAPVSSLTQLTALRLAGSTGSHAGPHSAAWLPPLRERLQRLELCVAVQRPLSLALARLPGLTCLDLARMASQRSWDAFEASLPHMSQLCELRLNIASFGQHLRSLSHASTLTRLSSVSLTGGSAAGLSSLPALARLCVRGTKVQGQVRCCKGNQRDLSGQPGGTWTAEPSMHSGAPGKPHPKLTMSLLLLPAKSAGSLCVHGPGGLGE